MKSHSTRQWKVNNYFRIRMHRLICLLEIIQQDMVRIFHFDSRIMIDNRKLAIKSMVAS